MEPTAAYVHRPDEGELRWTGETSTYLLATGEQTGSRVPHRIGDRPLSDPHNASPRAVLRRDYAAFATRRLAAARIDRWVAIEEACLEYGIEFVGPLRQEN